MKENYKQELEDVMKKAKEEFTYLPIADRAEFIYHYFISDTCELAVLLHILNGKLEQDKKKMHDKKV